MLLLLLLLLLLQFSRDSSQQLQECFVTCAKQCNELSSVLTVQLLASCHPCWCVDAAAAGDVLPLLLLLLLQAASCLRTRTTTLTSAAFQLISSKQVVTYDCVLLLLPLLLLLQVASCLRTRTTTLTSAPTPCSSTASRSWCWSWTTPTMLTRQQWPGPHGEPGAAAALLPVGATWQASNSQWVPQSSWQQWYDSMLVGASTGGQQ
jgi:hypothetical protein